MGRRRVKGPAITAAVLLALGAALTLLSPAGRSARGAALASNVLFGQASVFLLWGLIRLLVNLRMFTSFAWGVKSLRRLFRNRAESSEAMKDGYLAYRDSRPVHRDAPALLAAAGALLAASLVCAALA